MDLQDLHRLHQRMMFECQPANLSDNRLSGWPYAPSCLGQGVRLQENVEMQLDNTQLWQQFHQETTEMIITKLGRRMFPMVQVSVSGLDRRARYCVLLEITPYSKRRHKYVGSGESGNSAAAAVGKPKGWTSAGAAEPQPPIDRRLYIHPESPATGAHWMQQSISFLKLKLTNNAIDHHNNIVLTSMHKYIPRIWIIRTPENIDTITPNLFAQPSASFTFPETEFIAVTAYQNDNITKLKINNNPFAKGFRETGQSRSKRKYEESNCPSSNRADDESGVISSSESEPQSERSSKRAMIDNNNFDDSGISSSGGSSPPPSAAAIQEVLDPRNERPPKLHRPWDDTPVPSGSNCLSSPTVTSSTDDSVARQVSPHSSTMPTIHNMPNLPAANYLTDFYRFPMFYNENPIFSSAMQLAKYHQQYRLENLHVPVLYR